jgi:XRE family transcriptional regulator, master regulator for biofilm formation
MLDLPGLGTRIRELRELREASLTQLAERAGIAKSYLAKVERGEVDNPGLKTLSAIAQALEITVADLIRPSQAAASLETGSTRLSEAEDYRRLLEEAPSSLRQFVEQKAMDGERLSARDVRALAYAEFRGRRPQTAEDWSFLYHALKRSVSGS